MVNHDRAVAVSTQATCMTGEGGRPTPYTRCRGSGYDARMWQRCSVCKSPIAFGGAYLKCGVSTCNRKRFQLYFCSDSCWDAHNPDQNHRNPSYTEHRAPAGPPAS